MALRKIIQSFKNTVPRPFSRYVQFYILKEKFSLSLPFQCAESEATRQLVQEHGGLTPLVSLLKAVDQKDLLCAATGAVWKCSKSPGNVKE